MATWDPVNMVYVDRTPSTSPQTPTAPAVNTSQPNPATVSATPTTNATPTAPTTPPTNSAPDTSQYVTGTLPGEKTPSTFISADVAKQYGAALQTAKASGPAPQDSATAATGVALAKAQNPPPPNMTVANNTLAQDPGYQKLLADATQAQHTLTQGATLLDQYKQMETDAGLPAINTQLLSTKNIIDGTEDDIRKEVQAAGGFATNSQIMALSDARNKTLIQNYNNLLATKTNAENQINTMIGLAGQDKQNAIAAANQQLNIDQQLNDYAQKFQSNAQEAYKNVLSAVGYSGLMNSLLNSDPTGKSLALAEQTLGMQPGQLKNIATQEKSAQNLQIIQAAGVTSPFVVTAQGEVWNSQTGYAYESPEDFLKKTGMTLEQANAKKSIQPPPPNMDMLIKKAQLSKAQTDAQYAGAINQANINQSNASAAASAASTAKTKAEADYMKVHNGMTPAEVQAQEQAVQTDLQKINTDASGYIEKLAGNKIKWTDAFNAMQAQHPDLSTQAIDSLLQSNNYRS